MNAVTIKETWIANHYPAQGNIPLTMFIMSNNSVIIQNPQSGNEYYPTVDAFDKAYAEFDYDWTQVNN